MISHDVRLRNNILSNLYKHALKPIFFAFDPEKVHDRMIKVGALLGRFSLSRGITEKMFGYKNEALEQDILGIDFKNPVGLSAGFDKNAELTDILPSVGFGFAEVGSITGEKCAGNPGKRLWRLPESKSLVVYYGLKNDGCEEISKRLQEKIKRDKFEIPIGTSVAMTNCEENTDIAKAVEDFAKAFKTMEPVADYVTVNISCPNTLGGQPFIIPENLEKLLARLDEIQTPKPIFIKLSPDMTNFDLDALLAVVDKHRVHGIICSNLTKKRDNLKIKEENVPVNGGISGKVVEDAADTLLSSIYKKKKDKYVLIGSGGVFTPEDAYKKIRLGASLVQIVTGMIFEGPQVISEINSGLAEFLKRDGFNNISEAIGIDNKG